MTKLPHSASRGRRRGPTLPVASDHDMHVIKTGISTEAAVLKALAHNCPERFVELRAALMRNQAAGAELVRGQQLSSSSAKQHDAESGEKPARLKSCRIAPREHIRCWVGGATSHPAGALAPRGRSRWGCCSSAPPGTVPSASFLPPVAWEGRTSRTGGAEAPARGTFRSGAVVAVMREDEEARDSCEGTVRRFVRPPRVGLVRGSACWCRRESWSSLGTARTCLAV